MPMRGEKITVQLRQGDVRSGIVRRGGSRITWTAKGDERQRAYWGQLRRRDEGELWVRGWDTPEALAFRAGAAL